MEDGPRTEGAREKEFQPGEMRADGRGGIRALLVWPRLDPRMARSCGGCWVAAHVAKFPVAAVELAVRGVKVEYGTTSEMIASGRM